MIQPEVFIQPVIEAALRGDATLKAMFPANRVRLYDVPPTNAPAPYLVIGEDSFSELEAEALDLSAIEAMVHVWSRTDPPGKVEAKAIGARVREVLLALADTATIRSTWPLPPRYLIDTDDVTCHGVITVGLTYEPA